MLSSSNGIRYYFMHSTQEDLEPPDDDWPLFQHRRYLSVQRSFQRHF